MSNGFSSPAFWINYHHQVTSDMKSLCAVTYLFLRPISSYYWCRHLILTAKTQMLVDEVHRSLPCKATLWWNNGCHRGAKSVKISHRFNFWTIKYVLDFLTITPKSTTTIFALQPGSLGAFWKDKWLDYSQVININIYQSIKVTLGGRTPDNRLI